MSSNAPTCPGQSTPSLSSPIGGDTPSQSCSFSQEPPHRPAWIVRIHGNRSCHGPKLAVASIMTSPPPEWIYQLGIFPPSSTNNKEIQSSNTGGNMWVLNLLLWLAVQAPFGHRPIFFFFVLWALAITTLNLPIHGLTLISSSASNPAYVHSSGTGTCIFTSPTITQRHYADCVTLPWKGLVS